MSVNKFSSKKFLGDPSLWFLLVSNIVTILVVISEGWNLSTVMWVYWLQSITIGFFNFIRILQLKEFSTEGFKINDRPAQPTQSTKIFVAFFFLFHYGLFHLVYLVFLLAGTLTEAYGAISGLTEVGYIAMAGLIFFINHLFSYFYNRPRDTKKQNIGSLMTYPYARIIPMHLTLVLGAFLSGGLLIFLALKTFADVIMHNVEHGVLRKGEKQEAPTI